MKTNTKQPVHRLSIHRKKVIKIADDVKCGINAHNCTHYGKHAIIGTSTEKGGHAMVNLSEGMSTKHVAMILSVSERTVRNMCKLKQIVHYKVGTKIVILPEDLTNYINTLKVEKE